MTELSFQRHGAGRPLLFIHGATLDHRMWDPQLALADRFEVITYDMRGFGRTPGATAPFTHYGDAAALLDELGLRDVVVIGHSIGAHHGLDLALARPDLVTGFVSVCMSGLASVPYPDDILAMFDELKLAVRTRGIDAAKAIWARCGWFTSARARPELAALLDRYLADYSGWYWLHDTPPRLDPPAATRLGELAIPTIVIDGGLDLAYNHAIADALVAGIRGAQLVRRPDVGHMASLEAPEVVEQAIRTFDQR